MNIKDKSLISGVPNPLIKESEEPIYLFVPYYVDLDSERQKEIDFCLEKNIENLK
jgi:hypothetical protein